MTLPPSDPSTLNQPIININNVVDGVETGFIGAVEAMIIADVPALGYPVLKQIWQSFFRWIADYFVRALETSITFAVIDSQVLKEKHTLSDALTEVITAEKTGDPDAIKKAIQEYANAHSALVHFDGSAPLK